MLIQQIIRGVASVLSVNTSPLYRYPYRNGAEALVGDWKRIGSDVEHVLSCDDE